MGSGRYLAFPSAIGEHVPNATSTEDGFMSAADKAKLDALPSGSGGGSGDASWYFRFFWFILGGNGAGARTCTGARVGDVVVNVCGMDAFGAASDPPTDRSANFESTITVNDQIQQLSGNLTGLYNLPIVRRAV